MAKLLTYLFIMSGVLIVFHLFGIIPADSSNTLLSMLLNPADITASDLLSIVLQAAGIAALGIIGTLLTGGSVGWEFLSFVSIGTILFNYGIDFYQAVSQLYSVNPTIAVILFSPFLIGYIFTVVEWVRGVTT